MAAQPQLVAPPRFRMVPERVDSLGAEAAEFARSLQLELDPWQVDCLDALLGRRADGTWAAFEFSLVCGRQNGKNVVAEIAELFKLLHLGERNLVHTAHRADMCMESFARVRALLESSDDLARRVKRVVASHGQEAITLVDGARLQFRTRGRSAGRGFHADTVVFDEAGFLPTFAVDALIPALAARPNVQIIYLATAPDDHYNGDAVVLSRLRSRALAGDKGEGGGRLCYLEWSADLRDPDDGRELLPDEIPEDLAADPAVWAEANPALGARISEEYVALERETLGPRGFAVERLGVGSWPRPEGGSTIPISLAAWTALTDLTSEAVHPVVLAVDVSPSRRSAVALAGRRRDGLVHAQLEASGPGTDWVLDKLDEMYERIDPWSVVLDPYGPAGALVAGLEARGIPLVKMTTAQVAHAAGALHELVGRRELRHLGQEEVTAALRTADTRPVADAWTWGRRSSRGDVSALIALTAAVWGVGLMPPEFDSPEIF